MKQVWLIVVASVTLIIVGLSSGVPMTEIKKEDPCFKGFEQSERPHSRLTDWSIPGGYDRVLGCVHPDDGVKND
jgi:hypothetical protein